MSLCVCTGRLETCVQMSSRRHVHVLGPSDMSRHVIGHSHMFLHVLDLFSKIGWSRLNSIFFERSILTKFFWNLFCWVEPAQVVFVFSLVSPHFSLLLLWLNPEKTTTIRMHSGWLRVARGGFGAKAPPLAARPESLASGRVAARLETVRIC